MLEDVAGHIARREWATASVHEWEPTRDSVQFSIIKCPNSLKLGLVVTVHPFELFSTSHVESGQILDDSDTLPLMSLANERWIAL